MANAASPGGGSTHRQAERSWSPRVVWVLGHLALLGLAAWLLFGGGIVVVGRWLGRPWPPGDPVRRAVLLKDDPANQGRLYTGGFFRLARHVNYFGDTLWVAGWALLTRSWWAVAVPLLLAAAFVGYFIPSLARYLRARYGEQYDAWARETKTFVPFFY